MQEPVERMKDLTQFSCAPRPDRAEIATQWLQSGLPEGFSMEWVFDRYLPTVVHADGQM